MEKDREDGTVPDSACDDVEALGIENRTISEHASSTFWLSTVSTVRRAIDLTRSRASSPFQKESIFCNSRH